MTKQTKKDTEIKIDLLDEFIEKCADLEHTRWSNWQKYLHSKLVFDNYTTGWVLSQELKKHYEELIAKSYADLPEESKEKDRVEVRKYLPLMKEYFVEIIKEKILEEVKNKKGEYEEEVRELIKNIKI